MRERASPTVSWQCHRGSLVTSIHRNAWYSYECMVCNVVYQLNPVIQKVADEVHNMCVVWVYVYRCTIDFFHRTVTDIPYLQRYIVGTIFSMGKERMENEAEEQESPGDLKDDDFPDLSLFIPDDAQR